jgi:formylglycine-generating enzyme required for sulfatase activity
MLLYTRSFLLPLLAAGAVLSRWIVAAAGDDSARSMASTAFTGSKAGDKRLVAGMSLCWCPPGKFIMGSPRNEPERRPDEAQVEVTLTKGFWMAKFETTQGDWKRVVGPLPGPLTSELPEGDDLPVGNVNFAEAEAFCQKLTELGHQSRDLPDDWEFRLPTEAQWEYACRAGTKTATSFGDKLSSKQANFKGKPYNGAEPGPSLGRAAKVGSYPANPWGLHDMHGNTFEWCRDWYHPKLPGGIDPDLRWTKDGSGSRVRRGGCWADEGWPCRSAFRLRFEPERRYDHIGFRVIAVQSGRPISSAPRGVLVYSNNFDGPVGSAYPEWSSSAIIYSNNAGPGGSGSLPAPAVTNISSPNNTQRFLGLFGGPPIGKPGDPGWNHTRVNQTVSLALSNLPPHEELTVTFDLYVIRSWDGNSPTYGPDRFVFSVAGGPTSLDTTFSNNPKTNSDSSYQDYPNANSPPWTGAFSRGTLGYDGFFQDGIYRLQNTFPHSDTSVTLQFMSSLFEGKGTGDEAWGLDNVIVWTSGVQHH